MNVHVRSVAGGIMGLAALLLSVIVFSLIDGDRKFASATLRIEKSVHARRAVFVSGPAEPMRTLAMETVSAPTNPVRDSNPIENDNANHVTAMAQAALARGSAERGATHFASVRTSCLTCHKIGPFGGNAGPDLSSIGSQRTPEHLAESVLFPNRQIEEKYRVFQALTGDGQIVRGFKIRATDIDLVLRDPVTQQETCLTKDELEQLSAAPSLMPEGLAAAMSHEQKLDVIAFLVDLGPHRQLLKDAAHSLLEQVMAQESKHAQQSGNEGPPSVRSSP